MTSCGSEYPDMSQDYVERMTERKTETARILDLLDRTYDGDAWHGLALREILEDVTAAQAARKPAGGGHSIWELVEHIAQWENVTFRRLQGEPVEYETDSDGDWPRVTQIGDSAWQQTLARLDQNHRQLRDGIINAGDAKL